MNREIQQNLKDRQNPPEPVLANNALYLGDNGRCLCGKHHGMSARYTGRDLSGRRVEKVTKAYSDYARDWFDATLKCEQCGRTA